MCSCTYCNQYMLLHSHTSKNHCTNMHPCPLIYLAPLSSSSLAHRRSYRVSTQQRYASLYGRQSLTQTSNNIQLTKASLAFT